MADHPEQLMHRESGKYEVAKGLEEGAFAAFSRYDATCFAAEMVNAGIKLDSALRILEVGYGNGRFLGWCRERGFHVDGLEKNQVLVARARQCGFKAFASIQEVSTDTVHKYDAIVAFDVIEHIERDEIVAFIVSLKAFLKEKGRMIFRFPNGDNPFALYLQNGDITHRTAIGKATMQQIASLARVKQVYYGRTRLPLKNAGFLRAASIIVGIPTRAAFSYVFAILFAGGARFDLTANVIAVVEL
jgi:2-polyprenyl-3-methyl-5-hydroxy-6-metoxy-1,4-benzoquinol methylase